MIEHWPDPSLGDVIQPVFFIGQADSNDEFWNEQDYTEREQLLQV